MELYRLETDIQVAEDEVFSEYYKVKGELSFQEHFGRYARCSHERFRYSRVASSINC